MLSLSVRPREARLVGNLTPLVASMSAARWDRAPEGLEARPGIGWRRAIQSKDHQELDISVGAPLGTRRNATSPRLAHDRSRAADPIPELAPYFGCVADPPLRSTINEETLLERALKQVACGQDGPPVIVIRSARVQRTHCEPTIVEVGRKNLFQGLL
jgi:hypothetical protein